ncbi:MAG TPA: hypothetical protein VIM65_02465 [Cyclobacteriaceae bacterium]
MKNFINIILIVVLASCSTLEVTQRKDTLLPKSIGIKKIYCKKIPLSLREEIDSAVLTAMNHFNCEQHSFELTAYQPDDNNYIVLDFTKAKLISKKHRNLSYVLNTVAPIISLLAGMAMPVLINYTPRHKINSTLILLKDFQVKGIILSG